MSQDKDVEWIIKDAVHGVIKFKNPKMCKEILDTSCMQRLRRIKQTGLTYLVFPSAEHTRFQHSIGVAYIAGMIASNIGLLSEEVKYCEAAGLLHDVGIFPFSHTLERGDFGYIYNLSHVDNTREILSNDSELKDVLKRHFEKPDEIVKIIESASHKLHSLIDGPLDADKLDYLQRDSYFTGVKTEIDPYTYHIFRMDFRSNKLYVLEKGLANVEAIFCARYRLTQIVYFHHAVRVAGVMLNRAVIDAFNRKRISKDDLKKMGDEELLNKLIDADGYAKEFAERLRNRRLYKRVTTFEVGREKDSPVCKNLAMDSSAFLKDPVNILRLENYLATKVLGKEPGSILVDIPREQDFRPPERFILLGPDGVEVLKKSRYIDEIDRIYAELRTMRVYSDEGLHETEKEKCRNAILDLARDRDKLKAVMNHDPWLLK